MTDLPFIGNSENQDGMKANAAALINAIQAEVARISEKSLATLEAKSTIDWGTIGTLNTMLSNLQEI